MLESRRKLDDVLAPRDGPQVSISAPFASSNLCRRLVGIYGLLIVTNLLVWIWALVAFQGYPVLLGTAVLAYTLGLRHAVDADHIAAIDNVTRKLMQDKKRPVAVGFFFALGHATVVVLTCLAIAAATTTLPDRFAQLKAIGAVIGTSVSAIFLVIIAVTNIVVLGSVWGALRRLRRDGEFSTEDFDHVHIQRGLLGRLVRPLYRLVAHSWQMYPIGFLFGMSFDTATEVGLLGISSLEASKGMSIWSIMIFPALFTTAMALIDTSDGVLMLGAYGWAFTKPVRKLRYDLIVTLVSVLVALVIGGIELLALAADEFSLSGPSWAFVATLTSNFGSLGYFVIAIFMIIWLGSAIVYRITRYEAIEAAERRANDDGSARQSSPARAGPALHTALYRRSCSIGLRWNRSPQWYRPRLLR